MEKQPCLDKVQLQRYTIRVCPCKHNEATSYIVAHAALRRQDGPFGFRTWARVVDFIMKCTILVLAAICLSLLSSRDLVSAVGNVNTSSTTPPQDVFQVEAPLRSSYDDVSCEQVILQHEFAASYGTPYVGNNNLKPLVWYFCTDRPAKARTLLQKAVPLQPQSSISPLCPQVSIMTVLA